MPKVPLTSFCYKLRLVLTYNVDIEVGVFRLVATSCMPTFSYLVSKMVFVIWLSSLSSSIIHHLVEYHEY